MKILSNKHFEFGITSDNKQTEWVKILWNHDPIREVILRAKRDFGKAFNKLANEN